MRKKTSSSEIKPIFILSSARSGTTTLSNHLSQHPDIASIKAKEHGGVHECHFISNWIYIFDDLDKDYVFFYFMQAFKESDIFRLSNIDEEIFYRKKPKNIIDVVNLFMKEYCKNQDSSFWLNNSPKQGFYLNNLIKYYPSAYYIILRRPIIPTVKSSIKRYDEKSLVGIAKKVLRYRTDFDGIDSYRKKIENLTEIDFNRFIKHKESSLKEIIEFLGLKWDNNVLKNPYMIQSSFGYNEDREYYLDKKEEYFIKILNSFSKVLPYNLLKKPLRKYWDERQAKNFNNPPFYYKLHPYSKYMKGPRFQEDYYEK